jgi:hypothetical protein
MAGAEAVIVHVCFSAGTEETLARVDRSRCQLGLTGTAM